MWRLTIVSLFSADKTSCAEEKQDTKGVKTQTITANRQTQQFLKPFAMVKAAAVH